MQKNDLHKQLIENNKSIYMYIVYFIMIILIVNDCNDN